MARWLYQPLGEYSISVDICDDETQHALVPTADVNDHGQQAGWASLQRPAAAAGVSLLHCSPRAARNYLPEVARKIATCPLQVG
jgi:hypothetical protein